MVGGEKRERSRVKMFYFCCQCLWLETDKLQELRARRESGMNGVWEEGQEGRKTKCLVVTTIICVAVVLPSF